MDTTMIQVTKETRSKLQQLRLIDRESYDGVINRLIKERE